MFRHIIKAANEVINMVINDFDPQGMRKILASTVKFILLAQQLRIIISPL